MRRSKREMMELYRQICDLRRQGKKRAQISRECGCSISTVDRAIRMCGEQDIRQDRFEDHREKILAMYGDGATLKEMAEETGMSVSGINRRLVQLGKRRKRGWHPEGMHRNTREAMMHRERTEPEEEMLETRQYAVHVRRVRMVRVKVGHEWKTMQDVSDWWL